MGIYQGEITGKLISRQSAVGTKSEGPDYFICPSDKYDKWGEIHIGTNVMMWMKDPVLHELIGEQITVKGEIIETKDTITMDYTGVIYKGKLIPAYENDEQVLPSSEELEGDLINLLGKESDNETGIG
ncbi:MAG: hypothetical protein GPJ51_06205 [Candidatus Heimdallarchaeota archaeon]|nr:hypothetical protein [Candidatus Heimdallarchaeota archaeon]